MSTFSLLVFPGGETLVITEDDFTPAEAALLTIEIARLADAPVGDVNIHIDRVTRIDFEIEE